MSLFPARLIVVPSGRRAAFYLACEEHVAHTLPEGAYLFIWQVSRTVVMGRHQVARAEVDLDFCAREGIDVVRRRSGGGAIFADEGNLMLSLITPEGAVEPLFKAYAEAVAAALQAMGAPATVSGRNDILLSGEGKICGNAFYHLTHRNIVHGTMLYDTTPRLMLQALHPDPAKLQAKGVESVRRRVALLKDFLPFGIGELRRRLEASLTCGALTLSAADLAAIERREQDYYDPQYTHFDDGLLPSATRIEGVGALAVRLTLSGGKVSDVQLTGDYFELADARAALHEAFVGHTPAELPARIAELHPEAAIRGLTEDSLLRCVVVE